jgi:hypothetical protein
MGLTFPGMIEEPASFSEISNSGKTARHQPNIDHHSRAASDEANRIPLQSMFRAAFMCVKSRERTFGFERTSGFALTAGSLVFSRALGADRWSRAGWTQQPTMRPTSQVGLVAQDRHVLDRTRTRQRLNECIDICNLHL